MADTVTAGACASPASDSFTSTHPTQPTRYHVFLSFRGPDSRKTFTDHLYAALVRKGIVTFRDDEDIKKGQPVEETLREAIQQSLYFIVVLSQRFASSRWCLNELLQILQEAKQKEKRVLPVFYDVEPGNIGLALAKLEGKYSNKTIERWERALSEVAKFAGWPAKNRHEAKLVEEIATEIWNKLCVELPSNFEYLVGDMKSKAERIISLLGIGLDHKCIIGIWGMGGAGKTTLGRFVYNTANKKGNFEASCFLADIREDSKKFGLVHLQKKLLSNLLQMKELDIKDSFHGAEVIRTFLRRKKVLIVLDDVSHRKQLEYLARNKEWFAEGSKIIITTRDKHLLTQYEHSYEFRVGMLPDDESLKLLNQNAFKKDQPESFTKLSEEVVGYAGGHPMALEVLGSFLCTRQEHEWRRTIDTLTQYLRREILSQLRVSYDELEEEYKTIFLDIACFFNKEAKYKVANMLKICGLDEIVGIKVLAEKSLLSSPQSNLKLLQNARECQNMHDSLEKTRGNYTGMEALPREALEEEASKEYLNMHYLLQEMGRIIVFQESPINAGGRSRLWSWEDINLVLKENKGTKHVQSIILETQQNVVEADWDANCFSKMINLRLLDLSKDRLPSIDELWNLQSLQLCNSKIKKLWKENTVLNKLRIIDMSGSECLSETPDLSGTPNLEELLLNGCRNLIRVDESVGQLKKLVRLGLKGCRMLETLPAQLETDNLRGLILKGCFALVKLPDFGQNMTNLYFLDVSDTGITQIPSTISNLIGLKILDVWNCNNLESLPADLPPHLNVCANNSPKLKDAIAQLNLCAPLVPMRPVDLQGPIHIFVEFEAGATTLEWFKCSEYWWGKDPSSGEFATITADIPSKVVADSNEQCWGIAVCLFLKSKSQASQRSYIVWSFQNGCHSDDKTKMDGNLEPDDDCVVYVGFYPLDNKKRREASQLHLSLSILTTSTARDLHDWEIRGCWWRLVRKVKFDKWREDDGAASPSGHGSSNSERGESGHGVTERRGKRKYEEIL
ncbi:TMV resistance protein N-like [Neltuma alba]|uniref:TMV resistance protein N-like n=1 Tax=Neltuma alba TaxID=207710 RepID=UPI0010A46491|nr:TMV resistance protein N-like [Prosopis alba]